ncbi:MAG: VanW family protein [Firmicutes bacterium]|nr:VanW family protein [Bacillota bacterium]
MKKQRKLFCERNALFFAISQKKGILLRHLRDLFSREKFAKTRSAEVLPNLVSERSSGLIKRGPGIDPVLQENKAVNISLASAQIHHLLIRPGETFSFWRTVGKTSRRKGYLDGRVIEHGRLIPGTGGGLCNLGNTIHLLILHSPLTVTEFHHHSDALAPDEGKRVPFSAGTSVCYNYIDYRFRNDTDQTFQLLLWCENERLCGQLRSQRPVGLTYELTEEDHHFRKEGERYYRVSKIYRLTRDARTGEVVEKKLILDNHSQVMFDPALIPPELIRQ